MIGLVLAGGKSSRLGRDKTQLRHNGRTLLEHAADLLGAVCAPIYVSCRDPRVAQGFPVILDQTERVGPLGGIATALRELRAPIFVLACDLPFMAPRFLHRLLDARDSRPSTAVMTAWQQEESGFIESLVAIYEPAALPFLDEGIATGRYKLSRLIPPHLRHTVGYPCAEQNAFFNVNRPEDLKLLTSA